MGIGESGVIRSSTNTRWSVVRCREAREKVRYRTLRWRSRAEGGRYVLQFPLQSCLSWQSILLRRKRKRGSASLSSVRYGEYVSCIAYGKWCRRIAGIPGWLRRLWIANNVRHLSSRSGLYAEYWLLPMTIWFRQLWAVYLEILRISWWRLFYYTNTGLV